MRLRSTLLSYPTQVQDLGADLQNNRYWLSPQPVAVMWGFLAWLWLILKGTCSIFSTFVCVWLRGWRMMNTAMHSSNRILLLLLQQEHQWMLWGNSLGTKLFVLVCGQHVPWTSGLLLALWGIIKPSHTGIKGKYMKRSVPCLPTQTF